MKMKIVLMMVVAMFATAQAELVNGDFEGGTTGSYSLPAGWGPMYTGYTAYTSARTVMPSGGVGGGAFLRLNDYPSWPSTPQVGVRQDMPVVAGTSYTFTVWAKQGNPGGSDTAWGYVTWLSSGGSSITGYGVNGWLGTYSSAYSGYSVPGDDWTFIEWGLDAGTAPIVAPPGATSVAFYLCQYNVGGSLDFDNASIVPEPMTMALLGLGALMLRRRK